MHYLRRASVSALVLAGAALCLPAAALAKQQFHGSDAPVASAGWNPFGELAQNVTSEERRYGTTFEDAIGLPANVLQVSAGCNHGLAVLSSGHVLAWGWNGETAVERGPSTGDLGDGKDAEQEQEAIKPVELPLSNVKEARAGCGINVYLLEDGEVYRSGYGIAGGSSLTPVKVEGLSEVTQISVGQTSDPDPGNVVMALLKNGTIESWGEEPRQAELGALGHPVPEGGVATAALVEGAANVSQVSTSGDDTIMVAANHEVFVFGSPAEGEHGNGGGGDEGYGLTRVASIEHAVEVAAGGGFNDALLNNGEEKAWGWNRDGRLGIGRFDPCHEKRCVESELTPVTIATGVARIFAGNAEAGYITSPSTEYEGGEIYTWGAGGPQLGIGEVPRSELFGPMVPDPEPIVGPYSAYGEVSFSHDESFTLALAAAEAPRRASYSEVTGQAAVPESRPSLYPGSASVQGSLQSNVGASLGRSSPPPPPAPPRELVSCTTTTRTVIRKLRGKRRKRNLTKTRCSAKSVGATATLAPRGTSVQASIVRGRAAYASGSGRIAGATAKLLLSELRSTPRGNYTLILHYKQGKRAITKSETITLR
jgi:alpha-tubulin suppressor-like RCC1 family protein